MKPTAVIAIFVAVYLAIVVGWMTVKVIENISDNACGGPFISDVVKTYGCSGEGVESF